MMQASYLAGIAISDTDRSRLLVAATAAGLEVVLDTCEIVVACSPSARIIHLGDAGILIGPLHQSGSRAALEELTAEARATVLKSGGVRLFEAFWGAWVSVIRTAEGAVLLRAPFGRLPCLYRRKGSGVIAASDIDLLRAASGEPLALDPEAIGRQLLAGDMRHPTTSLCGIEEVQGGSRLSIGTSWRPPEGIWSPWRFVGPDRCIDDLEDASRRLRHQCMVSIASRTAELENPLLLLSGGLDSSIVAASLSAQGRNFACLNLATRDRAGDEREYAGLVARHLGCHLEMRSMTIGEYDFARTGAVRLPRPVTRGYEQLIYAAAASVADELGCDGIVDGGGGDNVFCSLRSVSPAADCLLDPGGIRHFRRVCEDIGHLAQTSQWKVRWKAIRRSWSRARPYPWPVDRRLLTRDIQALASTAASHPWLAPGEAELPGRGAHIAILIAAQGYVEDGPYGTKQNCISPLVTQPLIEHCLAIPSWRWFARGNNRAAARKGYEDLLPPGIAWRNGKGTPESFLFALLERNRDAMTSHLLDGVLASAGVIDTAALAKALRDTERLKGTTYGRILQLVDAESWARGIIAN
ncbi:asparagine synthase-related protein [Novosphingobium sp. KA1]|uniref:asparagine synthase-related protein n=1 Tax=Novosphingobium sp. (strain KA1) TaxID=164608 RepID=UPI001A8E1AC9|nr:asparagine synthase-related protein [Novosphingobium sp. KA1]QSR19300.1 hypothetical protein CA833_19170 [Novosphingobium sp. KA1]